MSAVIMKNKGILPCPFCGNKELDTVDLYTEKWEGDAIECSQCMALVPIESWMKRETIEVSVLQEHEGLPEFLKRQSD